MEFKKRQATYSSKLIRMLEEYAASRSLDFDQYSPWHMRIRDGGYVTLDVWTSGKYYVLQTDYYLLTKKRITERGGERGDLPHKNVHKFLDNIFFAADMLEETDEP